VSVLGLVVVTWLPSPLFVYEFGFGIGASGSVSLVRPCGSDVRLIGFVWIRLV